MPVQDSNNWKGNKASKRCANLRAWGMQRKIADEINPKINRDDLETRLEDAGVTHPEFMPRRQANRRKTDARGGKGASAFAYFHPEMGKPEVGVRMVSLYRKNEGLEVEIEGGEEKESGVVV